MKKFLLITLCMLSVLGTLKAQAPVTVTIGSGSGEINYSPSYIDSYTSLVQQIFLADEMQDQSGKINNVSFKCTFRSADRNFKVYMVNTDKTSFNNTSDWVTVTAQDLVYEGTVSFTEGNWTTITFDTPFTYKKGKNLLLCINDVTGTSSSLITKFASDATTDNRIIYGKAWDNSYGDATNITKTGTLSANVNHVLFSIVDDGSGEELEDAPEAPTNLAATALSDTQIELTWNASENATSYSVYQNDNKIASGLSATTYIVENLEPATNYCFTVTASSDQESEKSNEACTETQAIQNTFHFDFNNGTKTGMRVFQGPEASHFCPNWELPQDHSAEGDVVVEQLTNIYYGKDGSIAVYSMTFEELSSETHIPDNYIVTEKTYLITETSTLEWDIRQAGNDNTDQYAIVVSEDGSNFEIVWFERYSNKTGETKAYSLADYAGKELYIGFRHYKQTDGYALCLDNIKLVTDSEITPEEPVDFTDPTIPDNVKAIAFSETTIRVSWNASDNATKYNVYAGNDVIATVTETSYMVEGLEPGTNYCFTVTAANEEKESDKSSEVCDDTFDAAPEAPAAPTNLVAKAEGETTISLSWDAVDNAATYNIYQGTTKLITVTETTYLVTGLQAETNYCFTVTALNGGGESVESNEACATTKGDGIAENTTAFNIYPNPVENELFLATEVSVEEISIYDIYGRQAMSQHVNMSTSQHVVDVTSLNSGVYFVKVVTSEGEIVKRFIKK